MSLRQLEVPADEAVLSLHRDTPPPPPVRTSQMDHGLVLRRAAAQVHMWCSCCVRLQECKQQSIISCQEHDARRQQHYCCQFNLCHLPADVVAPGPEQLRWPVHGCECRWLCRLRRECSMPLLSRHQLASRQRINNSASSPAVAAGLWGTPSKAARSSQSPTL